MSDKIPGFRRSIIFECSCHDMNHTFRVSENEDYDKDLKEYKCDDFVYLEFALPPIDSVWHRIKHAIVYLWKGEYVIHDVILTKEKAKELHKHLGEILDARPNRKTRK